MFSQLLKWQRHTFTIFLLLAASSVAIFILYPVVRPNAHVTHPQIPAASVYVSVDRTVPITTSQFSPGITYIDNTVDYPWDNNDHAAVNRVKSLIRHAIPYQNTAIMAWGAPDPWPDPSQPEPKDWSYLDSRMKLIHNTGGIPVITLCEAPWWMKGALQADGSTQLLTSDEEWSDSAYSARILDNKMGSWLHLVQRAAERYMVAPYHVRYFQVWNELKGYYNPVTKGYDYTTSPGDPTGPHAKHGYTYMYNLVYHKLMQVATSLGIPASDIKVGGPYATMGTWAEPDDDNVSHLKKAYGIYDQRYLNVVQYWLRYKAGAGFITLDAANKNDDYTNITDPFTASEKFADVIGWIRSLNNTTYPGATTLPIWWAEWYVESYASSVNDEIYNASIKTYALMRLIKAGGGVVFLWGGLGDGAEDAGLWSDTTASGGGQPRHWYSCYKAFKDYFPPGTRIYRTTVSAPKTLEALASGSSVMLVNKTSKATTVSVNYGKVITLPPYQVTVADY
jgi:hypothetical protein